jgi:hypothetical protein
MIYLSEKEIEEAAATISEEKIRRYCRPLSPQKRGDLSNV